MEKPSAMELARKKELKTIKAAEDLPIGLPTTIRGLRPLFPREEKVRDAIAKQEISAILIPAGWRGEAWPPFFGGPPPFELAYLFDCSRKKYFLIPRSSADAFWEWLESYPHEAERIREALYLSFSRKNWEIPPSLQANIISNGAKQDNDRAPDIMLAISLPASIFSAIPRGQRIRFCQEAIVEKLLVSGVQIPDKALDDMDVLPF